MDGLTIAFWAIIILATLVQYAPICHGIPWYNKMMVFIIIIICAPLMTISTIITALLDCFLPEGWDMQ